MIILRLAWQSLMNRKFTTILTILSIAVSVMLLLGVEKVRSSAYLVYATFNFFETLLIATSHRFRTRFEIAGLVGAPIGNPPLKQHNSEIFEYF